VLLVVVGDGEAVDLLLHPPDQGEQGGGCLDADLHALRRHQRTGAVTVVLHHAQHRHGEVQLGRHLLGHPSVLDASVDEQQVGEGRKLLIAVQIPAEPALQHLRHGAVVIGTAAALDLEAAVVPLQGPSVHEHHHAGHLIGAAGVGDVIALHAAGQHRQAGQLL